MLWVPQRKKVTDFKGPDGKWRKLVVEENGDAVIENVHFGDGQISAHVTPKTIQIKSRIF